MSPNVNLCFVSSIRIAHCFVRIAIRIVSVFVVSTQPYCLAWRQILSMASNVRASHLLGLGPLVPKCGRDTETV